MIKDTKVCTKCDKEKPLSDFHKNSQMVDGHAQQCKSCVSKYNKARYQKIKHNGDNNMPYKSAEKQREYQRNWDAKKKANMTPEEIAEKKDADAAYRQSRLAIVKAQDKVRYYRRALFDAEQHLESIINPPKPKVEKVKTETVVQPEPEPKPSFVEKFLNIFSGEK